MGFLQQFLGSIPLRLSQLPAAHRKQMVDISFEQLFNLFWSMYLPSSPCLPYPPLSRLVPRLLPGVAQQDVPNLPRRCHQ
jgi:hypothetical protein